MVVVIGTNNEAILNTKVEDHWDMTIDDSASALKGTMVALADPNKVSTTVSATTPIAGFLARDKVANDGRTQVPILKRGKVTAVCSGAVVLGLPVAPAGVDNMIKYAGAVSGAQIIGYALETGADQEAIEIMVRLS